MSAKFYICRHCGNQIEMVHSAGVPVFCCGQKMEELVPNTVEASGEKHLPVVKQEGDILTVEVGSVEHPMLDAHYIQWIYLETEQGGMRVDLKPGEKPAALFNLAGQKPVAAYAYCNLHGLWMTKV